MPLLGTGEPGGILAIDATGPGQVGLLSSQKVTLCWPNRIDSCALSGGAWDAEFPQTRLLTRQFSDVARTTSTADLTIAGVLDQFRPLRVAALAAHNLSTLAKWRVKFYYDAVRTQLLWDSDWMDVWPRVYDSLSLPWEAPNFWTGKLSEEDRALYNALAITFTDAQYICKSFELMISDADNADGYFQIGRIFIADAWQPELNRDYGDKEQVNDLSTVTRLPRVGTKFFDAGARLRSTAFDLSYMGEAEAQLQIQRMRLELGTTGEILYCRNLMQTPQFFLRSFIGHMIELNPIDHPNALHYHTALGLEEIV